SALCRLRAFEDERAKRLMLERYLDASPFPVMFVDADGALLFATAEGRRWYERWTGGAVRLRSRDASVKLPPEIRALLERAARQGMDRTGTSGEGLSVRHPSIPGLTVRADVSWPAFSTSKHPCYVLTFAMTGSEGAANRELSANALRMLQRLSPTERRVALLVLEGLRNDEISQRLCRSRRTIEFQLNSIY